MQTLFEAPTKQSGLFGRFKQAVSKTRVALTGQIGDIFKGQAELSADLLEDLEMTLIEADLGVRTVNEIIADVRSGLARDDQPDAMAIQHLMAERMLEILRLAETGAPEEAVAPGPEVILTVGVNGVGKTTTIGKLAQRLRADGPQRVALCRRHFPRGCRRAARDLGRARRMPRDSAESGFGP